MFYLGQPYSHPSAVVREERYLAGAALAACLIRADHVIYAPIVHWHPVAKIAALPADFKFWQRQCFCILARCDLLIVYCLDGWAESVGLTAEISYAEHLQLPIAYFKRFPDGEDTSQLGTFTRGTRFPVSGRT